MKIRLAKPEDTEAIVNLFKEWGKVADVTAIQLGIGNRLAFFIICELDNKIVGMASFTLEWSPSGSVFWWNVSNIYTLKDYRGRGVCRSVLEGLIELSKATPSCIGVKLVVSLLPGSPEPFYGRLGFVATDNLEMVYNV